MEQTPAANEPETPATPSPAVTEPRLPRITPSAPKSAATPRTEQPAASGPAPESSTTRTASAPEPPPPEPSPETEGGVIDGSTAGRRLANAYRKGSSSATGAYGGTRFQPRRAELRFAVNERAAVQRLLRIAEVEATYHQENGAYGTPEQLLQWRESEVRALGLQGRPWATFQGYRFQVELPRKDFFVVFAVPLQYGQTGAISFYIDREGVVRGADKSGAPAAASDPPY